MISFYCKETAGLINAGFHQGFLIDFHSLCLDRKLSFRAIIRLNKRTECPVTGGGISLKIGGILLRDGSVEKQGGFGLTLSARCKDYALEIYKR